VTPPADPPDRRGDSVLTPDVDPTARATPVGPGAPTPDLGQTGAAIASPASRSAGVTVLAVLAVLYTLYFAREFLLPVTIAVLLGFLLSPVVRAMARVRVPVPLGAAVVVLALVGALGAGVYELADPAQDLAARAPATLATAQQKVRGLLRPVQQAARTAERAADATADATAVGGASQTPEVVVKGPSLASRVFGTTQRLLAGALEVVVLLYFLLAAGDLFLQKLVKVLPRRRDKRTAVEVAREIEASVSAYLLTTAALNVGEGLVVAGVLALIGLPNPLLWGALVALLEFVPYLGAATLVVLLAVAGLTASDGVGQALLAPASFLAINLVWANVVAPLALARRLTLNPVAVFVGLAFWWFLWGIPGAFLAVPLLATFKVVCDHVGALAAVGEFLGQRDPDERRQTAR
jgi:predicted PurR-regulated permease PerM